MCTYYPGQVSTFWALSTNIWRDISGQLRLFGLPFSSWTDGFSREFALHGDWLVSLLRLCEEAARRRTAVAGIDELDRAAVGRKRGLFGEASTRAVRHLCAAFLAVFGFATAYPATDTDRSFNRITCCGEAEAGYRVGWCRLGKRSQRWGGAANGGEAR